GEVCRGNFAVIVSGDSKGCGSSREHSPYAELYAGARLIVARSFENIYRQNCHNIGLLTSTDFCLLPRLAAGEHIPLEEFTRDLDPISAAIVRCGGLFAYNRARMTGHLVPPGLELPSGPLNLVQKIIAAHARTMDDGPRTTKD